MSLGINNNIMQSNIVVVTNNKEIHIPYLNRFAIVTNEVKTINDHLFYNKKDAHAKIEGIAQKYKKKNTRVLLLYTALLHRGVFLNKATNLDLAKDYVKKLSGRRHRLLNYVQFIGDNYNKFFCAQTIVKIKLLSSQDVSNYLQTKEWVDKIGCYNANTSFVQYIKMINGSFNNFIGLPIKKISNMIHTDNNNCLLG